MKLQFALDRSDVDSMFAERGSLSFSPSQKYVHRQACLSLELYLVFNLWLGASDCQRWGIWGRWWNIYC